MADLCLGPGEKLNDSNYEIWAQKMQSKLVLNKLWAYTSGKTARDPNNPNDWDERDEMALAAIKSSVNDHMLGHIGKANTSKAAWDILKKINGQKPKTKTGVKKIPKVRNKKLDNSADSSIANADVSKGSGMKNIKTFFLPSQSTQSGSSNPIMQSDANKANDPVATSSKEQNKTTNSDKPVTEERNPTVKSEPDEMCNSDENFPRRPSADHRHEEQTSRDTTDHRPRSSGEKSASHQNRNANRSGGNIADRPSTSRSSNYQDEERTSRPTTDHSPGPSGEKSSGHQSRSQNRSHGNLADRPATDRNRNRPRERSPSPRRESEYNLILGGVSSSPEENCKRLITEKLKSIGLDLKEEDINKAYRKETGENPKPMVVNFFRCGKKNYVFKARRFIRKKLRITVDEDIPEDIVEVRSKLFEREGIERAKGNYAEVRFDKLQIFDKLYRWDDESGKLRYRNHVPFNWDKWDEIQRKKRKASFSSDRETRRPYKRLHREEGSVDIEDEGIDDLFYD